MVKRTQHIGTFLHNEMGISIGGIFPMCGRSSIQRQKIFSLKPITHALRGTVKVFLQFFTRPSPDCGSAMSHGDAAPGDRRTHRMACAPASTERGCGSM